MSHSTNFSKKARQVTEVPMTAAELTAAQTAGELPPNGTPIVIVDNTGAFVGRKESTGASSQPTSGGGAGGSLKAWAANTAVDGGEIRRATIASGTIGIGDFISSNTARTTGATFNATEAGNWTELPDDPDLSAHISDAGAHSTEFNLKAPLASPAFTGTPTGITKTHVGLGSVDNTSDSTKDSAIATITNKTIDGGTY